ncbi:hypothetical protein G7047_19090 [Diaphorobacter sp. HDW4A]|uniref:hypothetical protein n=1 Tax=Diaphorobacter sp. HDW4A TaxID=2714924 RepID=UPI001409FD0E|nr:hypothetical protein [Diaphorobacter sp. HDW4A]QIL81786.1 hypothetical protein G7047_19090 [Diaphorobacter sp. HDW4A]
MTERSIYLPQTAPGQTRRRVSSFVGTSPNQTQGGTPAITWVIEDEILLEGGGFAYVPVGQFVSLFDPAKDAETFADIDVDTGETNGQIYTVGQLRRMFYAFALNEMVRQYSTPIDEPEPA